jgi:hypothetical protein
VHVLSLIDIKASFVCLVGDTVSDSFSKHALSALHVVVHDIFQIWFKCFFINQVEVDKIFSGDLDSNISFNKVDESFDVYLIILHPSVDFLNFVICLFEE